MLGAYLHDLGNAIHRIDHEKNSIVLANGPLERLLNRIFHDDAELAFRVKCEVLHALFSSNDDVPCLSIEAGTAKIADGTDMAHGRTRIPYRTGKVDIHSLSALSITRVEIEKGTRKPVQILVSMNNPAGVFQIEEVLEKKIQTSGIQHLVEVLALDKGIEIRRKKDLIKPR